MAVGLTPIDSIEQKLIVDYLTTAHYYDLLTIVRTGGSKRISISVIDLFDFSSKLAHDLLDDPRKYIRLFNSSITVAQEYVMEQAYEASQNERLQVREGIVARFSHLPLIDGLVVHRRIPSLTCQNRLISVSGTVIRAASPKMIERTGKWECVRCKREYEVEADMTLYGQIPKPPICTSRIDDQDCRTFKFVKVFGHKSACEDYQEVKIQESTSSLEIGTVPRTLTVLLRADLVDTCKAGDTVNIIGVLQSRWKPLKSGGRADLETFFEANNVIVGGTRDIFNLDVAVNFAAHFNDFWSKHQESRLTGRSVIVKSFCPQIHGMFLPKLAVLLILLGGCSSSEDTLEVEGSSGPRKNRREGHLLLVGDPGTAKSQLLIGASKLASRAILTTGSGSTNAGLTVAAVKDGPDWTLEAGALVLADKGICCIDEFNALKASDRTAIHEAMEQQTLSVAKAGLVCKLNTRCSIIAACNSKGKFEEGESITSNTALASPLLSRFDLILVLLDRRIPEWDQNLSSAIIDASCGYGQQAENDQVWDFDLLKAYISNTKQNGQPKMTNPARVIISKYYQHQRSVTGRDAARTTVRLLESLIRLSQAHAKLLWQPEILAHDALTAIMLMESSLQTHCLLGNRPDLYASAPDDPNKWHAEVAQKILARLHINPAVFEEELGDGSFDEIDEILCSWAPTQR